MHLVEAPPQLLRRELLPAALHVATVSLERRVGLELAGQPRCPRLPLLELAVPGAR